MRVLYARATLFGHRRTAGIARRRAQPRRRDPGEYHVPVNTDVPDIEVLFVDEVDDKVNALGAKGVGEIGIVGTAAAIANALFNATGVRVRDLPITLD
jgi:xanthine dehydrogenase YagR molybdenum-binding subunit